MAKEIRKIEIEPSENGGHTVIHHYRERVRHGKHGEVHGFVEPEHHVFGAKQGHEMLAHVANHLEIPETQKNEEEPEESEGEEN